MLRNSNQPAQLYGTEETYKFDDISYIRGDSFNSTMWELYVQNRASNFGVTKTL